MFHNLNGLKPVLLTALICWLSLHAWANIGRPPGQLRSAVIDAGQLLQDLKTLSADEMEGRKPETPGGARARAYILKRFEQSGIKPFGDSYLQFLKFKKDGGDNQRANVVGHIKGKRRPDRYLVITAHYDHLGIKGGKVYNGANDNASGVAALFTLAAYFSQHAPDHSLIFAALDAEESGLVGAKKFVSEPPVGKQGLVLNVNLDMICRDEQNRLYAVGTSHYPYLKPYLAPVATRAPIRLLFGHDGTPGTGEDWTKDSDHYAFHREKIPFIYFGVEDYEHHHEADDDYENITPAFYIGAVETILDALKQFDAHLADIEKQRK